MQSGVNSSNLAHIHQSLRGHLNESLVKKSEKALETRNSVLYIVNIPDKDLTCHILSRLTSDLKVNRLI